MFPSYFSEQNNSDAIHINTIKELCVRVVSGRPADQIPLPDMVV